MIKKSNTWGLLFFYVCDCHQTSTDNLESIIFLKMQANLFHNVRVKACVHTNALVNDKAFRWCHNLLMYVLSPANVQWTLESLNADITRIPKKFGNSFLYNHALVRGSLADVGGLSYREHASARNNLSKV
jgi:hypothetical protein